MKISACLSCLALSLISLIPADSLAQQIDRRVEIVNLRYHVYPEFTRIVIDLAKLREFTYGESREQGLIFVDVLQAKLNPQAKKVAPQLKLSYLKRFGLDQRTVSTVRLAAEVDFANIKSYRVYLLNNPVRIVCDIYSQITEAQLTVEPQPESAPSQLSGSGYSVSRQLGLGVKNIVLDAGHGGSQPGCISQSGLMEKNLTLELALGLKAKLVSQGYNVYLTRETDVTLSLEERTAVANRKKADLFISIHVNAHRDKKREGVETFYLNFSSDPNVIETAILENAPSAKTIGQLTEIVKKIVQNNKVLESRELADKIQKNLIKSLMTMHPKVKDHGVKGGPFWVLIGGQMPSVLVEVAHLSNTGEERLLKNKEYRQLIVDGIYNGIMDYIKSLGKG